jgi:hypothetical protein
MVLRGAAFNGLIMFSLCLFAWGCAVSNRHDSRGTHDSGGDKRDPRHRLRSWVRWAFTLVPALYLVVGLIAVYHQILKTLPQFPPDPPYMEFTLLLLGGLGLWLLWCPPKETGTKAFDNYWLRLAFLFFVLMAASGLGWWSTKVLYAQQIIYSYNSQIAGKQGAAAPASSKK